MAKLYNNSNSQNNIKYFLSKNIDESDTSGSNYSNISDITPPITPPINETTDNHDNDINKQYPQPIFKSISSISLNSISSLNTINPVKNSIKLNIKSKYDKIFPELIYYPPYNLLFTNNTNISLTIENYINKCFNISNNYLKSNVHPDTIKAIIVPYSNIKDISLCCSSAYYQLYNRVKPIKKIIVLCTNNTNSNQIISTSMTHISSYKNFSKPLHKNSLTFNNLAIEQLKPYLIIDNENIKNEIALISNLPFIETIAQNASLIPILISNKIILNNTNIDNINNIIYILKNILKNEDTILICISNLTTMQITNNVNMNANMDIYNHISIKKKDNSILQFIYDTINGITTRSTKIDDILFMQNTPSNSTMTMYLFSQLLNSYYGFKKSSCSSSSSISSNDSGISLNFNKTNNILYSRITSYYNSFINKQIDLTNFKTSQLLFTTDNTKHHTNSQSTFIYNSFIGIIFTSHPPIDNTNIRVLENSFSEYEKLSLIGFIKEQLYLNTIDTINTINTIDTINHNIAKINNKPINIPLFKANLGTFITVYNNNNNNNNGNGNGTLRGCIGTSETNNDDYTIENNISRFIIELTTKETKCRNIIFQPITFNEINNLQFSINILYHMKKINKDKYNSNQFKFGYDGLLFKIIINNNYNNNNNDNDSNNSISKYTLTSISQYFDNNINNPDKLLNELLKTNNNDTINNNAFQLFYNEGLLIHSNII
jgi:AmmeMemoRadiSam system protein B